MNKTKLILFFIITSCLITISCQNIEKIIDPVKKVQKEITKKNYEKNGLSFSYPDNWEITEDTVLEDGRRIINIEDSDNTLFIVNLPKSGHTFELEEYAEDFIKGLLADIPIGKGSLTKSGVIYRTINSKEYKGIRKEFSITLLGENIPHTTDFFLISQQDEDALTIIQAPDEDWKAAEKEFRVMFKSLNFEKIK